MTLNMRAGLKRDRVRDVLLDLVADMKPGEAIPSERDLCKELGVSRPTVRAAIDDLVRSGLLVREHGRGTFTGPHRVTQALASTTGNSFYAPPAEGNWLSRVLEFGAAPAGARLAARLQLSPADPVLRVVRLRVVDDEPMAIERIHLPHALVDGLVPAEMVSGSFYRLLRERFNVDVRTAVQTIEPTVTDETEAELLGVPQYAPALLFERTTRDAGGRIVEFTRSIYRGDRYRITSELSFNADSG
ncbi:GntR family transcriptional regulator [Streptosporangium becharense]|uniref:GntR family transcriptional regulator n=1 Tax=Streptosporangium becharense TaxID=1816182 RepID=A0A7W9IB72_9ACTN|nr:GntR family transcriptional regulator [Streptosporangium becharense]MBB2910778.1 GntR family transcriptional regulator [Streptosporangium becharense]MBB5817473.1 GntR family transcriptional regulator [Streptosporangium becharense]